MTLAMLRSSVIPIWHIARAIQVRRPTRDLVLFDRLDVIVVLALLSPAIVAQLSICLQLVGQIAAAQGMSPLELYQVAVSDALGRWYE
ncbi:MAG: hypothetical protein HY060_05970 [Proteobacteria bacterium]|nr:hypothetical protein [Pseudomonadota bacterium]